MGNSVQNAIAAALASSTGQTTQAASSSVRTVSTDSLKTTSKSGF